MACNYGRACGVLTVESEDVGDILMAENLAHPYTCGAPFVPATQIMVSTGARRTGADNQAKGEAVSTT